MKNYYLLIALLSLTSSICAQCFDEQTYDSNGDFTFTVPGAASDVFVIEIEASGANGGRGIFGGPGALGGEGATITAQFSIPGGSELLVMVGEGGQQSFITPGGAGGGGGTGVVLNNEDVLIAAGGGAGGAAFSSRRPGLRSSARSAGGPGLSVSASLIIGAEVDAELDRRGRSALARRARPEIHGTEAEKAKASFLAKHLGRGWK